MTTDSTAATADTATTATDTAGTSATAATADTTQTQPDVAGMEAALKKANKEAEKYRLQVKAFEDEKKTEGEKATERLAEAERKAAEAEKRVLRAEVAAETGVPARFLTGETEEDLKASAAEFKTEVEKAAGVVRKSVDTGQGARQSADGKFDANDWMRQKARS